MKRVLRIVYVLFFGCCGGFVTAYALAALVPGWYPEAIGGLVCDGRVEYLSFRQNYFCFAPGGEIFDIGEQMFRAVLIRLVFVTVPIGVLTAWFLMKFGEFASARRAAAGF
jgi:hypothetical protein